MDITYPLAKAVTSQWQAELDAWEQRLKLQAMAVRTLDTRLRHVRQFSRECRKEPNDVTREDVIEWASSKRWKPETRHGYYTSVRAFFAFYSQTYGTENVSVVLPSVRRNVPPPRPTPKRVVREAYANADDRGQLILALAACAGLRGSEIARVHLEDIFVEDEYALLRVCGKGGKVRNVPIPLWLAQRLIRTCMFNGGYAFLGNTDGHLAPCTVSKIARSFLPGNWTLHTLRHRYATNVYQEGRDLISLKDFLGHASVSTTQRYAQAPRETLALSLIAADIHNY